MNNNLQHHGIKGQKWGRRRYQNEDGSLTPAGKKRYINYRTGELTRKGKKRLQEIGENSKEGKLLRAERQSADINANWHKSYNSATDKFNQKINEINARFGDEAHVNNKKYIREVGTAWKDIYSSQLLKDFGRDVISNGEDWVKNMPAMDDYDHYGA